MIRSLINSQIKLLDLRLEMLVIYIVNGIRVILQNIILQYVLKGVKNSKPIFSKIIILSSDQKLNRYIMN